MILGSSYEHKFGARPLKRMITATVEDTITDAFFETRIVKSAKLFVAMNPRNERAQFLNCEEIIDNVVSYGKTIGRMSVEGEYYMRARLGLEKDKRRQTRDRERTIQRPKQTCWGLQANWRPPRRSILSK